MMMAVKNYYLPLNYLCMTLENYWKILAMQKACSAEFMFFDSGFLAVKALHHPSVLYDNHGKVFKKGDFEKILYCDNGVIAALPFSKTEQWIIVNRKNELVDRVPRCRELYRNGYHSYTINGETFYCLNYMWQRISLGYGVGKIVVGPNGAFAYQQKVRRYTYWYMCQIKQEKLIKSEALSGVSNIVFFANGSYVVYYQNKNIHVFNCRGEKIFACNSRQTSFRLVGRNTFCATNGKRYKGVYSAKDGKLVLENDAIYSYWENGAFYIPEECLLYLPKQQQYLRLPNIYAHFAVGESLLCFHFEDYLFVIDTNMSVKELRQKAINSLHKSSKDETYCAYLTKLLGLLH